MLEDVMETHSMAKPDREQNMNFLFSNPAAVDIVLSTMPV